MLADVTRVDGVERGDGYFRRAFGRFRRDWRGRGHGSLLQDGFLNRRGRDFSANGQERSGQTER